MKLQPASVTAAQFAALYPKLALSLQQTYYDAFDSACREFDIDTLQRLAAFHAQVAHESGGLRWMEEIGSPMYFRKYEHRADLGNTRDGDGDRYHGRGPIQLTGRGNYRRVGEALGLKLEDYPELAKTAAVGAKVAAYFFNDAGCNSLADEGTDESFVAITRKINGGINGLADRILRWEHSKSVLGVR